MVLHLSRPPEGIEDALVSHFDPEGEEVNPQHGPNCICVRCEDRNSAIQEAIDEHWINHQAELARRLLAAVKAKAGLHAISAHARGDSEEERRWLDLGIMIEHWDDPA